MGLETVTHINDLDINWPVGATDTRREGDDHLRNIKKAVKTTIGIDHDIATGKHKVIQLPEQSAPTNAANEGRVYTKDDGGDTELYYMDDDGNEVQLTKDGAINAFTSLSGAVHTASTLVLTEADGGKTYYLNTTSNDITVTMPDQTALTNPGWWVRLIKITTHTNDVIVESSASVEINRLYYNGDAVLMTTDKVSWYEHYFMEFKCGFLAHKNGSNQSISSSTDTQLTFGTEVYDDGAVFASNTFTVRKPGTYAIKLAAYFDGFNLSVDEGHARLRLNDAQWRQDALADYPALAAGDFQALAFVTGEPLAAADTVKAYFYHQNGSARNVMGTYSMGGTGGITYFQAEFLHR